MALTYESLSSFLKDELALDASGIDEDTPLFSSGLIDSFSLVALMAYLEKEAGFTIAPEDVDLRNFDSLGRVLNYVGMAGG